MPESPAAALLARAYAFAAVRHSGQKRRAVDEPYLHHLIEVANLLAYATDGADPVLVAGGVLHDTLEDTETTAAELHNLFGPEVAALVAEVTDPKGLTEVERRRRQVEHARELSDRAKLLKIADKTSNIRERLTARPPGLSDREIVDYVRWGAAVVAGCRGLNVKLEDAFDAAFETAMGKYGG